MGEVVAAALVSHQPLVMAPEEIRRLVGQGEDTTLVEGFSRIRSAMDAVGADTWVLFDTHWFTTIEHVVAGADHFGGVYTSDELPTLVADLEYDYAGAPELAKTIADAASARGLRVVNATSRHIAQHYPTLNLIHHMHRGEHVLTVGVCQTAQAHNFLEMGAVIGEAVGSSRGRVVLLASGGMSHRFWPMDVILDHSGFGTEDIASPEAVAMDRWILDRWSEGDHAAVIDRLPEIRAFHPEGYFGHYLMLAGALGGRDCRAPGRMLSAYENAVGTGQVHVWFDVKEAVR